MLGFDNASLSKSVQEGSRVTLEVSRRFGLRGGSRVHWEARLNGVLAADDVTPYQGDLVFAQGVASQQIAFEAKQDSIPEVLEVGDILSMCLNLTCGLLLPFGSLPIVVKQMKYCMVELVYHFLRI